MKYWMAGYVAASMLLGENVWAETSGTKVSHAHEHKAPHNGTLIVLGKEFAHLELVLDPQQNKVTGYILDGEAENPIRSAQPDIAVDARVDGTTVSMILQAVEDPLTGEKVGSTSEFSGNSLALKGAGEFTGIVRKVTLKGQDFINVMFSFPEGNE